MRGLAPTSFALLAIEVAAAKLVGQSAADVKGRTAAAAAYKPSASMEALQRQAAKCKEGDNECQMAIAMQMMDTPDAQALMAQGDAANSASPRYQLWAPPLKGGKVEVKAEYLENCDAVDRHRCDGWLGDRWCGNGLYHRAPRT